MEKCFENYEQSCVESAGKNAKIPARGLFKSNEVEIPLQDNKKEGEEFA